MKKLMSLGVIILCALAIASCVSRAQGAAELEKVEIFVNGEKINAVISQSDEAADTGNLPVFAELVTDAEDLPYLAFGNIVELVFNSTPQETEITLYDRLLRENGANKYADNSTKDLVFKIEENKASFELKANLAAALSSNSADYEPGKTIRGFSLSAEFEGANYIIAFAVRTDAL